jgi:cob(I)alamin adenosyltransferase
MKIYTKTGDQGYASILNGERISKDDEIIQITGKIDAVQSSIDIANVVIKNGEIKNILHNINEKLWQLAAEISNRGLSDIIKKPIIKQDIQKIQFLESLSSIIA